MDRIKFALDYLRRHTKNPEFMSMVILAFLYSIYVVWQGAAVLSDMQIAATLMLPVLLAFVVFIIGFFEYTPLIHLPIAVRSTPGASVKSVIDAARKQFKGFKRVDLDRIKTVIAAANFSVDRVYAIVIERDKIDSKKDVIAAVNKIGYAIRFSTSLFPKEKILFHFYPDDAVVSSVVLGAGVRFSEAKVDFVLYKEEYVGESEKAEIVKVYTRKELEKPPEVTNPPSIDVYVYDDPSLRNRIKVKGSVDEVLNIVDKICRESSQPVATIVMFDFTPSQTTLAPIIDFANKLSKEGYRVVTIVFEKRKRYSVEEMRNLVFYFAPKAAKLINELENMCGNVYIIPKAFHPFSFALGYYLKYLTEVYVLQLAPKIKREKLEYIEPIKVSEFLQGY